MTDGPPESYFHLPDTFAQDDPRLQNGGDPAAAYPQLPAITVSCVSCERIVGESSAFMCAVRHAGAIVMESMVSIKLGQVRVTEAVQGAFDQYCLYKPIHCANCEHLVGKMYISIAAGVPLSLLNKYTISRTQVLFYTHGACIPSLPLAESEEILRQLHPEPDEVAMNLDKIMSLLVYLKEEQDGIVRELRRVGSRCGVDEIDVGGNNNVPMGGREDRGEGWRRRVNKLEGEMEKLRELLGDVVNKGVLLVGKAIEPDVTLGEAVRDGDRANLAKRKRIEKPAVEANKRVAKSPSPTFIQQRRDKSSTKPAVVPPIIAKPWIVTPVLKAKGKEDVVEIEESEADEGGESSGSEDEGEEVSDSEEEDKEEAKEDEDEDEDEDNERSEAEETPPASAKRKTTKPALADALWKTREAVQGKIDNGREKGKERDREKENAKQQEKEKERATGIRTSLTQAKVGLIARRKTAGGGIDTSFSRTRFFCFLFGLPPCGWRVRV
ncbi:hypothetical protein L211DRAFT_838960 [Terfezia boudieri ATCC MYA-4762]|uniref:Mis18 domain-containing protein n=1 Tax=Terfezia boudieri ATCC MYA-4762 TaxID=1051890 RepID=A0A3N4LQX2_9PEZI|nr:hypothetical protein L211DRAFT_838960 [Terfezia boudieri ATCC MYA-4762]